MIIEQGPNDAEARFSDCRRYRYSLRWFITAERKSWTSVAFVMLNPSTADAFKLDPTVHKCMAFARLWGFDAVQVVNLFALRSPHPADLYKASPHERGADAVNDAHIMSVCANSERCIAAWGNHGSSRLLGRRGAAVRSALEVEGIELEHIGLCNDGSPTHPLARGKAFVPMTREPARWTP